MYLLNGVAFFQVMGLPPLLKSKSFFAFLSVCLSVSFSRSLLDEVLNQLEVDIASKERQKAYSPTQKQNSLQSLSVASLFSEDTE